MGNIPFKPRSSEVRGLLKVLKQEFDNPRLRDIELVLWRAAEFYRGASPGVKAYLGEIYHQLALRAEQRGDYPQALGLYDRSIQVFQSRGEVLGHARCLRDKAMCIAKTEDEIEGLKLCEEALALHDADISNKKGQRQHQITQTYLWRIEALSDKQYDLDKLVEIALSSDLEWSLRDQWKLCEFLVPRVDAETRLLLKSRLALIDAKRSKKLETIYLLTTMMIDIPIVVVSKMIRLVTGRE